MLPSTIKQLSSSIPNITVNQNATFATSTHNATSHHQVDINMTTYSMDINMTNSIRYLSPKLAEFASGHPLGFAICLTHNLPRIKPSTYLMTRLLDLVQTRNSNFATLASSCGETNVSNVGQHSR